MNALTQHVEEQLTDALPTGDDGGGRETIDNRERGCGHLKPNSAYVRCDVNALSGPSGEIPRFVTLDDPVEYREHTGKGAIIPGYKPFPGNSFGLHYRADGRTTTPANDIHDHTTRLSRFGFDGDHYGDITSAHAIDLLMSVGKTNWEHPDDFIQECRERGLNLKIPVSDRQAPPVVEPLRTRVWVVHPHGCGEGRPGIIGYSYLTRTVFTTGTKATATDPDIPKWAEDYAAAGKFDVVERGPPVDADGERTASIGDFVEDADTESADPGYQNAPEEMYPDDVGDDTDDRDVGTVAIDDGSDVTAVEIEFDASVGADTRRQSFEVALDGPLSYNTLKVIAGRRDDVDAGATPSTDALVAALVDAGAFVPAYVDAPTDGGDA